MARKSLEESCKALQLRLSELKLNVEKRMVGSLGAASCVQMMPEMMKNRIVKVMMRD
jgi:hypothetical protein